MGLAYKGLKQWDMAIRSFHEELRHHPDNIYAHLYLGESYEAMRDYPEALAHYRKVLGDSNLPDAGRIRKAILAMEAAQGQKRGSEN